MDELLNKKILIVDDEPELLQMIEDILFSEGFFNICTAMDCAKALSLAPGANYGSFCTRCEPSGRQRIYAL